MVPKPTAPIASAPTRPTNMVSTTPIAIHPSAASTKGPARRIIGNSSSRTRLVCSRWVQSNDTTYDSKILDGVPDCAFWNCGGHVVGAKSKRSAQRPVLFSAGDAGYGHDRDQRDRYAIGL